jgi:hypothetical protein
MFGRTSLRELVRSQHEGFMSYQEQRAEEWRRRDEEWRNRDAEFQEESRQREEEAKQRAEESRQRAEESRQREADLKRFGEETREYNREMLLRNEKVYKAVIAQVERNTELIQSSIEETRAQTQALFRLIDRFDEPGGAAAA